MFLEMNHCFQEEHKRPIHLPWWTLMSQQLYDGDIGILSLFQLRIVLLDNVLWAIRQQVRASGERRRIVEFVKQIHSNGLKRTRVIFVFFGNVSESSVNRNGEQRTFVGHLHAFVLQLTEEIWRKCKVSQGGRRILAPWTYSSPDRSIVPAPEHHYTSRRYRKWMQDKRRKDGHSSNKLSITCCECAQWS